MPKSLPPMQQNLAIAKARPWAAIARYLTKPILRYCWNGWWSLDARSLFRVVAAKGAAVGISRVPDGEMLGLGGYGIHEPLDSWPRVVPPVLLVPLLAFDAEAIAWVMAVAFMTAPWRS